MWFGGSWCDVIRCGWSCCMLWLFMANKAMWLVLANKAMWLVMVEGEVRPVFVVTDSPGTCGLYFNIKHYKYYKQRRLR